MLCAGLSLCAPGYRSSFSFDRRFNDLVIELTGTVKRKFRVELHIVRLQSSHDERCIFWCVPADAFTDDARRVALAVQDEPFTAFFTFRFEETSLFHASGCSRICLVRCELITEGSKNVRHLPRYLFIQRNPELLSAYHH